MSTGPLGDAQRADRAIGAQHAARARALAAFAADRPSSVDRQPGQPGCASPATRAARPTVLEPVSEWAVQELCVALSVSAHRAQALLIEAVTLVHQLPASLAALEAGVLHPGHLPTLCDRVAAITDPAIRARVEAALIDWARGRVTTPTQLTDKARRLILTHDPAGAAQRLAAALAERGVYPGRSSTEGLAQLTAVLTTPEARICLDILEQLADTLDDTTRPPGPDGQPLPPRSRAQKMADCLLDLITRPHTTDLPVVQAHLTIVASIQTLVGGDQPGEIDGHTVPATLIRHLATALGLLPDDATTPAGSLAPAAAPEAAPEAAPATAPAADQTDASTTTDAADADAGNATAGTANSAATAATATGATAATATGATDAAESAPGHPVRQPGRTAVLARRAALDDPYRLAWEAWWEGLLTAEDLTDPVTGQPPPGADPDWGPDTDAELARLLDGWTLTDHFPDHPGEPTPSASDGWADAPRTAAPSTEADRADGCWAAADQAVHQASLAVRAAGTALAVAERAVTAAADTAAADEQAWQASPAGRVNAAPDTVTALRQATDQQRAAIAELLGRTAGGGLTDRPRIAVIDALTGTLLALTDTPALTRAARAGTGLGPPPATDSYRPGAALDRFLRARDRRCRFPGCRQRIPRRGHLDHNTPWPTGPTSADNLTGYCTHHHRGKHQAPGWTHHLHPDARLTLTTPTGLTTTTHPPPWPGHPTTADATGADDPPPF